MKVIAKIKYLESRLGSSLRVGHITFTVSPWSSGGRAESRLKSLIEDRFGVYGMQVEMESAKDGTGTYIVTSPATRDKVQYVLTGLKGYTTKIATTGPRGGEIIGKTKSGKPIYDTHEHPAHKDFSKQDHKDAAGVHKKLEMGMSLSPEHQKYTEKKMHKLEHKDGLTTSDAQGVMMAHHMTNGRKHESSAGGHTAGVHQHPNAIWFQQSKKPEISAIVELVNDKYRWSILRQFEGNIGNSRSAETVVLEGDKPSLSEAKKDVFKVFENTAQLDKLMGAKPVR